MYQAHGVVIDLPSMVICKLSPFLPNTLFSCQRPIKTPYPNVIFPHSKAHLELIFLCQVSPHLHQNGRKSDWFLHFNLVTFDQKTFRSPRRLETWKLCIGSDFLVILNNFLLGVFVFFTFFGIQWRKKILGEINTCQSIPAMAVNYGINYQILCGRFGLFYLQNFI